MIVYMKKICTLLALTLSFLVFIPTFTLADTPQNIPQILDYTNYNPSMYASPVQFSIDSNGKVSADGLRVEQIAGTTFYAKIYWGPSLIRLLIRTDSNTKIVKHYGEPITISDISVGDYVSIQGDLFTGSQSLDVVVSSIKDWNLQTEENQFSGNVVNVMVNNSQFLLNPKKSTQNITVNLASTTEISKGSLMITPDKILPGDIVINTIGNFDHSTNTLDATFVKIYQDMSIFKPKNFIGSVLVLTNQTLPGKISVLIDKKGYTLNLASTTAILNKMKRPASLARFIVGDKVRIYGFIEEANSGTIDAQIIRNMSL